MVSANSKVNLKQSKLSCTPGKPKKQKASNIELEGKVATYTVSVSINPSKIIKATMTPLNEATTTPPAGISYILTKTSFEQVGVSATVASATQRSAKWAQLILVGKVSSSDALRSELQLLLERVCNKGQSTLIYQSLNGYCEILREHL